MRRYRIGLTGGIASGKSQIAGYLVSKGIPVIEADTIVHNLYQRDKNLIQDLANWFGPGILTKAGTIDRSQLGKLVFANLESKKQLEDRIHPMVLQALWTFMDAHPFSVSEIPLLYESRLQDHFDEVWLVCVEESLQCQRLMARNGLSEAGARQYMASQMPQTEKYRWHPHKIDNNGQLSKTFDQVNILLKQAGWSMT